MKKLCRIDDERKIAGVCCGLGEYFGIDPVLFRVCFIVFFLATVGALIYLVMWIIIPLCREQGMSPNIKRLYAVEEGKRVAGICAGLGHFFGVDPNIFRVVFVVSALLGGLGLLLYLVIYLIVPRSQTAWPHISNG